MKTIIRKQSSVVSLVMLAGTLTTAAQQFAVPRFKVAGGGGMQSTGGVYAISGTIGQHDAGRSVAGGNYSVTGGFWAFYAVPTPGAPVLDIKLINNKVMIYWPSPSTGYNLQVNTNLAASNWVTPPSSVIDNGTIKYILIDPPPGRLFFRLKHP